MKRDVVTLCLSGGKKPRLQEIACTIKKEGNHSDHFCQKFTGLPVQKTLMCFSSTPRTRELEIKQQRAVYRGIGRLILIYSLGLQREYLRKSLGPEGVLSDLFVPS